jgi:hypothetical protein
MSATRNASSPRQWLTSISFVLGLMMLGALVYHIGVRLLWRDIRQTGAYIFLVVAVGGLRMFLRSLGWAATFLRDERRPASAMFGRQVAGDALGYVSLAGPFLAEPLKAALVKDVDFKESLGSTLLENFVYTLVALALSISGIGMLVYARTIGAAYASLFAFACACVAFVALAIFLANERVTLPAILGWLGRRSGSRWQVFRERLTIIATRIERVKLERPLALWIVFGLAAISQGLMLLEVALVFWPLRIPVSLASLLIIESTTKLAKSAFFFIPGRVGADEGTSTGIVALLGMSSSVGLTLAVVRRIRAVVWTAVGLGYLAYVSAASTHKQSTKCDVHPRMSTDLV